MTVSELFRLPLLKIFPPMLSAMFITYVLMLLLMWLVLMCLIAPRYIGQGQVILGQVILKFNKVCSKFIISPTMYFNIRLLKLNCTISINAPW